MYHGILLCLWCFEDNCSVSDVFFCLMKGDRAYALTQLCIHNLVFTPNVIGRPRIPNSVACASAMTWAITLGWQFTSSFMMIYPCYYIHLHFVWLWIQFNTTKWRWKGKCRPGYTNITHRFRNQCLGTRVPFRNLAVSRRGTCWGSCSWIW
jgi:hypothetical protein